MCLGVLVPWCCLTCDGCAVSIPCASHKASHAAGQWLLHVTHSLCWRQVPSFHSFSYTQTRPRFEWSLKYRTQLLSFKGWDPGSVKQLLPGSALGIVTFPGMGRLPLLLPTSFPCLSCSQVLVGTQTLSSRCSQHPCTVT